PPRAALSAERRAGQSARALQGRHPARVGPGRAVEHGRVVQHERAPPDPARPPLPPHLRLARREREPRDRLAREPRARAKNAPRSRVQTKLTLLRARRQDAKTPRFARIFGGSKLEAPPSARAATTHNKNSGGEPWRLCVLATCSEKGLLPGAV